MHIKNDETWVSRFSYKFSTKNWDGKSGKCSGFIQFDVINETGQIINWIPIFDRIKLDIYTTPSWFKKNNSNFKYRKSLFSTIFGKDIEQEKRPSINSNKIIELNESQIIIANNWFREKYSSTLKNIIAIISGNNPTGSFTKPESAQMYINSEEIENKYQNNFIMFFDKICKITKIKVQFLYNSKTPRTDYIDLLKAKDELLVSLLDKLCSKHLDYKKEYVKTNLQLIEKKFNKILWIKNSLENLINNSRNKASKLHVKCFNTNSTKTENAHIKNVYQIKNEITNKINKLICININNNLNIMNENIEKLLQSAYEQIASENNLLRMPEEIHGLFDCNYFTFSEENGHIIWNEEKCNDLDNPLSNEDRDRILKKYSLIEKEEFLKRKWFIAERNKELSWAKKK